LNRSNQALNYALRPDFTDAERRALLLVETIKNNRYLFKTGS